MTLFHHDSKADFPHEMRHLNSLHSDTGEDTGLNQAVWSLDVRKGNIAMNSQSFQFWINSTLVYRAEYPTMQYFKILSQ
mgnify:CR=1 FL=1